MTEPPMPTKQSLKRDECSIAIMVLMADVSGGNLLARALRPRLGRIVGVKVAFGGRRMTVGTVRQCTNLVHRRLRNTWPCLLASCVLLEPPPRHGGVSLTTWVGDRYIMRLGKTAKGSTTERKGSSSSYIG